jgi:two-component system sensor histidine kinase YesM
VQRYRTVRESIFLSVSLLLAGVLVAFSLVVYDYASFVARDRFAEAMISLSESALANLDAQIAEMDRVSLTLAYSQVFQGLYARHLALPRSPATVEERIAKLENTEELIEICDTILGPSQAAPQVDVFDLRGEMIGAGYYSRLIERDAKLEPWFSDVVLGNGERILLPPHVDQLLEDTSVIVKGKRYVSLLRAFQDAVHSTRGIVEVEQYCDSLFGELDMLRGASVSIYVLDGEGRQLYPYEGSMADGAALLELSRRAAARPLVTESFLGAREPQIVASAASRKTGWTLLIAEPSKGLSMSIFQYAIRIAFLTLAAILCSLIASYFISRRLTVPIKALHAEIESLDPRNLDEAAVGRRRPELGEIDSLTLAFHQMRLKLNESIQEAVSLRAQEKEAQLVALQSQLNPHFLHNMLQTIAIMAEEGESAAIQGLIVNLARVLRYVASTEATTATLGTEMEYAESYLAAMRARFGDSLEYGIGFPSEMRDIVVPKLILQPLIENCFKYGTATRPPWRIEIIASREEGKWEVDVLDNGPGFPQAALAELRAKVASRREAGKGILPSSISGMGMLNSFERLRLAFGEDSIFEIDNGPLGGARVAIGAAIHG